MAKKRATKKRVTQPSKPERRATSGPTLASLRKEVRRLDREIVAHMNERARLVAEAGRLREETGDPIYCLQRERQAVERALELNKGPLTDQCVRSVFRELISGSRALAKTLRAAFLGPEYSYSHLAAISRFGQSVELVPVTTIAAVFEEVQDGQADYGIVPMENSTDGRIGDTLEMFVTTPLRICGEVPLKIHHNLLATGTRQEITQVCSKPQALSQCRSWIAKHLPQVESVEVTSTSEAARRAQASANVAAIASRQAGIRYQLQVLAQNVEDNRDNQTRFAVIGVRPARRTGDDKTSLLYEINHCPGALADVMAVFKRSRLNMTWIESYPVRGRAGRYLFFVEFIGHQEDPRVRRAIASLEKKTVRLEVLGSYARQDPIG
jgi:chorismate mutase / prephenate dehydratase